MTRRTNALEVMLLAALGACTHRSEAADSPSAGLRTTASGALAPAAGPVESLDVYVDGDVVHALIATTLPGKERWGLYYLPLSADGEPMAAPVPVDAGAAPPHRPSHGGDPQIAAHRQDLVAVWTSKGTGYKERGPLQSARSRDRGKTWEPGGVPAPEEKRGGQAFIDLAADSTGAFHVVWLDDRGDPKGLYHGMSSDGGASWRVAAVVDGHTCQCCWNRLVRGPGDQLHVLYRDSGPRDMAVAHRGADGIWRSLGRAGRFDWAFDGCPHVGGGLAVAATGAGTVLHATVWNGDADKTGLYHVRRTGDAWQPAHLLAADGRHSDIAVAPDGQVVAVWDMRDPADDKRAIFASESPDGGHTWSPPRRLSGPHRAGYPRILHVAGRFRVLWIEEAAEDKGLRHVTL